MADAKGVVVTLALLLTSLDLAEATCLPGGIPPERRANIEGVDDRGSVPFGIWTLDWDSINLTSYVVKLLAEEVLGYNSTISGMGASSSTGLYATAGCRSPNDFVSDPECSSSPVFVHHACLEVWGLNRITTMREYLAHMPEVIPEDAGDTGYTGIDGMYVLEKERQEAFQMEGLALEFYRSYHAAWQRPSVYFDNISSFDPAELKLCSESRFADANQIENYVRVTGDVAGIVRNADGAPTARCWRNSWWLAPACRSSPETCVPWVTASNGWFLDDAMQKATVFDMPLAITVSKTVAIWKSLSRKKRCLNYLWEPDVNLLDLQPTILTFPKYNALERERGILTSMADGSRLSKWTDRRLGLHAPRLRDLVMRVSITMGSINEMLLEFLWQDGNATHEQVACSWLTRNEEIWKRWIPRKTDCVPGKGLAGSDGSFVVSRANATDCVWCPPGRSSTLLVDTVGTTYVCEKCTPGRSQANPGQPQCSPCSAGTFADGNESRECHHCGFGTYNGEQGRSTCDSCAQTFITNFKGATSRGACICPEGTYRDEEQRDICLPCKPGMVCREGSDLLGYSSAPNAVVPLLKAGFWSSHAEPLKVFRCENTERCPGGTVPGAACAEGFEERACAACHPGHVLSLSTCVPCATGVVQALIFPVAPIAAVGIAVAVLYCTGARDYTSWDSYRTAVTTMFFITLNYYHVVNIIYGLGVMPSRSLSNTFEPIKVLSDVVSLFRPECSGLRGFLSRLVLQSHGPGVILVIVSVQWLISKLFGLCCSAASMDRDRLLSGYCTLILSFFTTVADMAFTIFQCAENPSGEFTLIKDRSVICYDAEWRNLVAVGVFAVLLWCVGFGTFLVHGIYVAPKRFHISSFQTRYAFLFSRFRSDVPYWTIAIILRGVLLNVGPLFIHSGLGRICWILAVVLTYTYGLVACRPWRHMVNNNVDTFAHLSLSFTLCICAWLARDSMGDTEVKTDSAVKLLQANIALVAVPFLPISAFLVRRGRSTRAQELKDIDARLVLNALELMSEGSYGERLEFLKNLTEHDYWLISNTKAMLLMELAHKRVRPGYSLRHLSTMTRESLWVRTAGDGGSHPSETNHVDSDTLTDDASEEVSNEEHSKWAADRDEAMRDMWALAAGGVKKAATEKRIG